MPGSQVGGERAGPLDHMGVIALPVRGMTAVGNVNKVLMRQFGAEGFEDAQPTHAAVKHANGVFGEIGFSRQVVLT